MSMPPDYGPGTNPWPYPRRLTPKHSNAKERAMPRGPDPYPVSDSVQQRIAACEALAKVQASRPMKPPGVRRG